MPRIRILTVGQGPQSQEPLHRLTLLQALDLAVRDPKGLPQALLEERLTAWREELRAHLETPKTLGLLALHPKAPWPGLLPSFLSLLVEGLLPELSPLGLLGLLASQRGLLGEAEGALLEEARRRKGELLGLREVAFRLFWVHLSKRTRLPLFLSLGERLVELRLESLLRPEGKEERRTVWGLLPFLWYRLLRAVEEARTWKPHPQALAPVVLYSGGYGIPEALPYLCPHLPMRLILAFLRRGFGLGCYLERRKERILRFLRAKGFLADLPPEEAFRTFARLIGYLRLPVRMERLRPDLYLFADRKGRVLLGRKAFFLRCHTPGCTLEGALADRFCISRKAAKRLLGLPTEELLATLELLDDLPREGRLEALAQAFPSWGLTRKRR